MNNRILTHSNLNNPFMPFDNTLLSALNFSIDMALVEDIGQGDATGLLIPEQNKQSYIIAREETVLCGSAWVETVLQRLDPATTIHWFYAEGDNVPANEKVCKIKGNIRILLTAERTALNYLQFLSAVATKTRRYVECVAGTNVKILDTRKTLPGLRLAEKYAVRVGGGDNQRFGLFDAILIKENHIATAGSITQAVQQARSNNNLLPIQVEVENLQELEESLNIGVTSILLDNFSLDLMRQAVQLTNGRALLEASGGIQLEAVRAVAETGVNRISIGSLTKDIQAIDYSMLTD